MPVGAGPIFEKLGGNFKKAHNIDVTHETGQFAHLKYKKRYNDFVERLPGAY